ncbi:hypothetical protein FS749_005892 [Ceratobasidium sp. UAMH 11750]|nr:hypothetical protein FS749_005892 [Ceratobasidium sp. UAMH 11750]
MAFKLGNATRLHKLTEPEEEAFFQRSNVTVCYLEANYDSDSPWFSTMTRKLPYLHTLCVANTSFPGRSPSHKSDPDGINHVCSPLRELTLINYGFALADFKKLLRAHSIQVLRLWDCYAFSQGGRSHEETGNLEEELSELVPNVRTYYGSDGDSSPYFNWGYVQF